MTQTDALDAQTLLFDRDSREENELAIAAQSMAFKPWLDPDDSGDDRLARAMDLIRQGRVTALGNTRLQVQGESATYVVTPDGCNCPNATKGHKVCYHAVAAKLWKNWQQRMTPLWAGQPVQETPDMPTPTIPTPPDTEASPVPPAVRVPSPPLDSGVLAANLEEWGKQRAIITQYIKRHFLEGTDYYTIKVGGRETKPTLGKPGSEKFLSLFQFQASFRHDEGTWDMLGRPAGVLCYVCTLHTRSGEVVGEGRGARDIKKDGGDINKAVKMAEKAAQIDAILRVGALSDAFTQDLDEGQDETAPTRPERPADRPVSAVERPGPSARQEIWGLLKQLGMASSGSREEAERLTEQYTGLELLPDHYQAIVERLKVAVSEQAA